MARKSPNQEDEALLKRIFAFLQEFVPTQPDENESAFIKEIRKLPIGLRAMASTHHLDISLTLDDIGRHFLNWPEVTHAEETFKGVNELGLSELADLFRQTESIMRRYLPTINTKNYAETLEREGTMKQIDDMTDKAYELIDLRNGGSIYDFWIAYAHKNPENVFRTTRST